MDIIKKALAEDIGSGDVTALSTIPEDQNAEAKIIAKEEGILCGIDIAVLTFISYDEN